MEDRAGHPQARPYRGRVLAELERREPEAEVFIRPQRSHADIVVQFAPIAGRDDPPGTPLSAELLLRPTIAHPDLGGVLSGGDQQAIHLKLARDSDGRPVDALHIHGYAPREESGMVQKAIWSQLQADGGDPPDTLEISAAASAASRWPSPSCCSSTTCSTRPVNR